MEHLRVDFHRMRRLLLLCILLGGCARLPAGDLRAFSASAPPRACLIRGYRDWYSTGVDQLAGELRSADITACVFREDQWESLPPVLNNNPRSGLILIGFSYGADDVILIARRLNEMHRPVDLLITIDPVTPAAVPGNVKQCVNFYEPDGFWDIFPWLRGVPLAGEGRIENIDIRNDPLLNEPGTSHSTIAANPKVHQAIKQLAMALQH